MSDQKWKTEEEMLEEAIRQADPLMVKAVNAAIPPVTKEVAETADLVICSSRNPHIIGQKETPCVDCGVTVYFSPSSPIKPPKICWTCVEKREAGKSVRVSRRAEIKDINRFDA